MRVLRPDAGFDTMIQTIFPPSLRALPFPRREATLDKKIQSARFEEERDSAAEDDVPARKAFRMYCDGIFIF